MQSFIFNHRSTHHSDGLHNLVLRLPAMPYLGLVGEMDPTPVKFTTAFWCGWRLTSLGLFIFTRCIPTPCIFDWDGFPTVSNLDIYLRALLRYWGSFSFSMSLTFLEGVLKWSANISSRSRAIYLHCFIPHYPPIISVVSTLVARLLFYSALIWRVSSGSCLSQKVPCFLGAPKFLKELLCACEIFPGTFSPCLIFNFFSYEEGLLGYPPCSVTGLLWWSHFFLVL